MANEIKVAYTSGRTVTVDVFQPTGSVRQTGIGLSENPTGGLYLGDCATIQVGDIIVAYDGTSFIGAEEYGYPAIAVKILRNKAVQTKATGAVVYYDDDGVTPILTQTPTDAASTLTRTPS